MVKNPPYKAGDSGSILGQGTKIPHAVGQLSPCATATELEHLNWSPRATNYRAHQLCNPCATTTERLGPGACAPQLEREKPTHHN